MLIKTQVYDCLFSFLMPIQSQAQAVGPPGCLETCLTVTAKIVTGSYSGNAYTWPDLIEIIANYLYNIFVVICTILTTMYLHWQNI